MLYQNLTKIFLKTRTIIEARLFIDNNITVQKKKTHQIHNVLIIPNFKSGKDKDIKQEKRQKKERIQIGI